MEKTWKPLVTQKEESKNEESKNVEDEEEDKTCCFKSIMEKLSSTRGP